MASGDDSEQDLFKANCPVVNAFLSILRSGSAYDNLLKVIVVHATDHGLFWLETWIYRVHLLFKGLAVTVEVAQNSHASRTTVSVLVNAFIQKA